MALARHRTRASQGVKPTRSRQEPASFAEVLAKMATATPFGAKPGPTLGPTGSMASSAPKPGAKGATTKGAHVSSGTLTRRGIAVEAIEIGR